MVSDGRRRKGGACQREDRAREGRRRLAHDAHAQGGARDVAVCGTREMILSHIRGLPYMTSALKGKKGVINAPNLRNNIDFVHKEGGGGQTIPKICQRHIWKPTSLLF